MSYCLSGLEIKTPSLHDYNLTITEDIAATRIINGVKYTAVTPGYSGNYIKIGINDSGTGSSMILNVSGTGTSSDPYIITVNCDVSNVSQQDIRNFINLNKNSNVIVRGTEGSSQIGSAQATIATELINGADSITLTNFDEFLNLTNTQIAATKINSDTKKIKDNILIVTDSDESETGIITVDASENMFPIPEEGFKVFIPEGISGCNLKVTLNNFSDKPTILGKFRYAPTRNDIETYKELIQSSELKFEILRNRTTFCIIGDNNGEIVVFNIKGMPLTIDGWLYIRPVDGSIQNIEYQLTYLPEYFYTPIYDNNTPVQRELNIIKYDWYGQYGYIFGGLDNNNNALNTIDKINIQVPSNGSIVTELSSKRYGGAAISDSINILIIGGKKDSGSLVALELFKGNNDQSVPFIELEVEKYQLAAASDGLKYVLSGGITSVEIDDIEYGYFNALTGMSEYGNLTSTRSYHSGCSTEYAAFFSGGISSTVVDIFIEDNELSDILSGFGFAFEEEYTGIDIIETLYIAKPSATFNFGNLANRRYNHSSGCNSLDMIFAGGIGDNGILNSIEKMKPYTETNSSEFSSLMVPRYSHSSSHNYSNFVSITGIDDEGFTINNIEYTKFSTSVQSIKFGELNGTHKDLMTSSLG